MKITTYYNPKGINPIYEAYKLTTKGLIATQSIVSNKSIRTKNVYKRTK